MEDRYKSDLEPWSIENLQSALNSKENKIDIDPEYQREAGAWTEEMERNFIDSVNRGIIPQNLIFNLDMETCDKICIDGKHRLGAIDKFIKNEDGHYLIDDETEQQIYYNKIPQNADKARVFTSREKSEFLSKRVPVVTYKNLTYADQVNIFQRIQHGKKLEPGELVICQISDKKIGEKYKVLCNQKEKALSQFKKCDRSSHLQLITELMILFNNGLSSINKQKREKFLKEIKDVKDLKSKFEPVGDAIDRLFTNKVLCNGKIKSIKKSNLKRNMFLVVIYALHEKFKDDYDEIDANADTIVKTIHALSNEDIKGAMNEGIMKEIFAKFNELYDEVSDKVDNQEPEPTNVKPMKSKKVVVRGNAKL